MLLKSGADCNLPMEDGRTPLHIAAETGRTLLHSTAEIGRTTLHIAAEQVEHSFI